MGERLPCKEEVSGSIPLISTRIMRAGCRELLRALDIWPLYKAGQTALHSFFDNCIAMGNHIFIICCQVTKGLWWMPWCQMATKGVVSCDKLR